MNEDLGLLQPRPWHRDPNPHKQAEGYASKDSTRVETAGAFSEGREMPQWKVLRGGRCAPPEV